MHQHSLNRITVFLTDQEFRITDSHGKVETMKHKVGDAVWGTPTTAHGREFDRSSVRGGGHRGQELTLISG
jgi:hypothetical protein